MLLNLLNVIFTLKKSIYSVVHDVIFRLRKMTQTFTCSYFPHVMHDDTTSSPYFHITGPHVKAAY